MTAYKEELERIQSAINEGPYSDDSWDSFEQYRMPKWYMDAKFGIFIHWGVYSVPAFGGLGEWYPRLMHKKGSTAYNFHVETYGTPDEFGYKDFIPMFTAEKYSAEEWVELFKKSGAKYIMPVGEHHDGFAMYKSRFNRWNAVDMGPKRDMYEELKAACEENGLSFCMSSHRAEHWWFLEFGKEIPSDVQNPEYADLYGPGQPKDVTQPDEAFLTEWLVYTCEMVDKFQPQVLWFDWWIEQPAFEPYVRKVAAYYYNCAEKWGKKVAINFKEEAMPQTAGVYDIERGQLSGMYPIFWQTDTSVSKNSWGYIKGHNYRTPDSIVHDLVDIVSKNGSLLLNIGPRSDGTIPDHEQWLLKEVGKWLEVNGEAIYNSRVWRIFGEGPTVVKDGEHMEGKHTFTSEDIRFTRNGNTIYAIVMGQPTGGRVTIEKMASECKYRPIGLKSIDVLGGESGLDWTQDKEGLHVTLPEDFQCKYAMVMRLNR